MTKAEESRLQAERATKLAKETRDQQTRREFEEIARQWRVMAEQAERQGR